MNRLVTLLLIAGLAAGLGACDKREGFPLPRTGAAATAQTAAPSTAPEAPHQDAKRP